MRITAHVAGADDDEYDDVLEAGFAEGTDDGLAVAFQRTRSAPDPWQGVIRDQNDLFDNTYCIVVGGATVYGGLLPSSSPGPPRASSSPPRTPRSSASATRRSTSPST
ncbi:hypothetical protein RM844_20055 [Streptomyces sp. DSM 44915]|uniref:Uncharacterized protein n=1 Tax=Streptomyces chisholmiae TaxID=3075540 RepID=A0ABU2JWI0_9ACTN|nr:hypothetical protein [Streptomyces sp. DSM 44915]MDT0268583.1 hypothetical protein [Streptomyces sp. DSM 44915]